jgi:hypothetical protein
MFARIYQPAKTSMSSGKAKTKTWHLVFIHDGSRTIEPLMGWSCSEDTIGTEVKLKFATKEKAVAFAEKNAMEYEIYDPQTAPTRPMSYADNFIKR